MLASKGIELLSKKNDIDQLSLRFPLYARGKIEKLYSETYDRIFNQSSQAIRESDSARRIIHVLVKKEVGEKLFEEYGTEKKTEFTRTIEQEAPGRWAIWAEIKDFFRRLLPPEMGAPALGA